MNLLGMTPFPSPSRDEEREAERERRGQLLSDLTADLAGVIAKLCDKHPSITADEVWDRARNAAQGVVGNYLVERP